MRRRRGLAKEIAREATIAAVPVFDVYEGKSVPVGRRSLAVAVKLQPADRILTDAEIDAIGQKLIAAAAEAVGATLRT